jgi:hypothetical protein
MKSSRFLHSCVLVENDGDELLFDPGNFSLWKVWNGPGHSVIYARFALRMAIRIIWIWRHCGKSYAETVKKFAAGDITLIPGLLSRLVFVGSLGKSQLEAIAPSRSTAGSVDGTWF